MINPDDIKAGMLMGQADATILRAAVARLNELEARVKAAEDAADKYLHEAKRHQRALLAAEAELARVRSQIDDLSKQPANTGDLVATFTTVEPRPAVLPDKAAIREIFMRNGFTIKDGQTDLKDYVYAAANELLALGYQPQRFVVKMPSRYDPKIATFSDKEAIVMTLSKRGKWVSHELMVKTLMALGGEVAE